MGLSITVLGATGQTGRELVRQALERGHDVTAVARDPSKLDVEDVRRAAGDVRDPESMSRVLAGSSVIVSALGVAEGERPGVLTDGARAMAASGAGRLVSLGAYGTGPSAAAAGWLTRTMLKAMSGRLPDKITADATVLAAGGTVFHAGPLSVGPLSPHRRTVGLDAAPRGVFPSRVSRATVAAAMLDEAESPRFAGRIALPLER
jgi:uncharacterized protein YbjT (DUF2867 family)